MDASKKIVQILLEKNIQTKEDLEKVKKSAAKQYGFSLPTNISLLKAYHKTNKRNAKLENILKTRPVRSLSGVVNISVLTKPFDCPGKCIYCPSEKDLPKSYLDNEPAVMRAILNNYHPLKQIKMRIRALKQAGHPTDKIELRIVGGTWSYYSLKYRAWFIKKCFDACNGDKSTSLKEAKRKNENAKHRLVCISVETRPDYIDKKEIKTLRIFGVTMVELGIQSLSDKVMQITKRGHGQKESVRATKLLKDAGFKVCHQVMLNLPGSTPEDDTYTFQKLFENSNYRPDFLKIYPCLTTENTPLYEMQKAGKYAPFSDKVLVDIISKIKRDYIPCYVRIQRIFRDIPSSSIKAGSKISNLREVLNKKADKEGWKCKCIRCREVKGDYKESDIPVLFRYDYSASGGKEIFLSFEDKKREKLFSLLRLRFVNKNTLPFLENSGIIREIRTYGEQVPVNKRQETSPQHQGLGKKLIKEAEKITKEEFGYNQITVISGVGVRDYWRKQGYRLRKTYMTKRVNF